MSFPNPKLIHYTVEVRDPVLGYWEVFYTSEPHWRIDQKIVAHHFIVWKWETIRTEFFDPGRTEKHCRLGAMYRAFEAYQGEHEDVRVRKTFKPKDGHTFTELVWENGQWEDC